MKLTVNWLIKLLTLLMTYFFDWPFCLAIRKFQHRILNSIFRVQFQSVRGAVVSGDRSSVLLLPSDFSFGFGTFVASHEHFAPTVPRSTSSINVANLRLECSVRQVSSKVQVIVLNGSGDTS